jgi:hypothetical protein
MKTSIKPQKFLTFILSLAAALLGAVVSSGFAQSAAPEAGLYKGLDLQISRGRLMNYSPSQEATLSNIVAYLGIMNRGAAEHFPNANFVVGDGLGSLKFEDLQLQHAPLDLALQALSVASGNKFIVREFNSKETPSLLYMLETNKTSVPQTEVEAFSLSGYIQHLKSSSPDPKNWGEQIGRSIDHIQSIIRQVVEEQRDLEKTNWAPLKFEFFRESDLLILIGPPDAVATAGKIIRALPGEDEQRGFGSLLGPSGGRANLQDEKLLQQLAKP